VEATCPGGLGRASDKVAGKKVKFQGIIRDKFVEKMANFMEFWGQILLNNHQ